MVEPLPDLRSRDLGGRGVLHQVEDRDCPGAAQPRGEILDADGDVVPETLLRDVAGRRPHVQEIRGNDVHVLAQHLELVRPVAEDVVEDLERDGDEIRVRDPRPVVAL